MEAARAEAAALENLSARVVREAPAGSVEESMVVNLPMTGVGAVQAVIAAAQSAHLGW